MQVKYITRNPPVIYKALYNYKLWVLICLIRRRWRALAHYLSLHFSFMEASVASAGCTGKCTTGLVLPTGHEFSTTINSVTSNSSRMILLALSISHTPYGEWWSWLFSSHHHLPFPHNSCWFQILYAGIIELVLLMMNQNQNHKREGEKVRRAWFLVYGYRKALTLDPYL